MLFLDYVNVFGLVNTTNALIPLIREFKAEKGSLSPKIINVSSIVGKASLIGAGSYAATKHAVIAITQSYRNELAKTGMCRTWCS